MKKFTALLLSVILLISCFSLIAGAEQTKVPTIYIVGQGSKLSADGKYNSSDIIYPVSIPDGYIGDCCKELALPLAAGLLTNKWKSYNDGLYDAFVPFIKDLKCDNNGNVTNGTGPNFQSSQKEGYVYHDSVTKSDVKAWTFQYDWRLDPVDLAEEIHDYIEFVKSKTNAEKVNVIARCFAGDIMLAYMDKYGSDSINDLIMVSVGFDGFESIGAIFSGKVVFNSKATDRFVSTYLSTDTYANDPMFETLRYIVTCIDYSGTLKLTVDMLQKVYKGIKNDGFKRILRDSVASMPSFWTYIGEEYYEDAKAYIFGGVEEEYSGLIEKIDNCHYNILAKYNDILDAAEANGVRIYNICKYGFQILPVLGKNKVMSDSIISTKATSLGATCADIDSVLSDKYINSADSKYISPDKQIDASTCKYPDHTWFVKNLSHRNMPVCLDLIYNAIINDEGYTTVTDIGDEFPQFMMASDDSTEIFPATADNSITTDKTNPRPLKALFGLLENLFDYIRDLFKK